MVASHYLEAYRADLDAADAPRLRARASETLTRAGERAASLAAGAEAQRYFEQAIELGDPGRDQARLHEQAGRSAGMRGAIGAARAHLDAAIELFDADGDRRSAARATAHLSEIQIATAEAADMIPRMETALDALVAEYGLQQAEVGLLAQELARRAVSRGLAR